jgi:acyl-CoA hydrolase
MTGKRSADSQIMLSQLMQPHHANPMGNIHGGVVMQLVDEAGALCAMRHAQHQVVTVAIDSMTFDSPVHVGHLVILKACLTWVGRTSMEVAVRVSAEDPLTGAQTHTNAAFVVYVALSEDGRPTPVAPLILETDEECRCWAEGETRQQHRLKR